MATIEAVPESFPDEGAVAFGRAKVVLTGPTTRPYKPEIRFIELHSQTTEKRFRLDIESKESFFAISLPEGEYRVTRVQIREGGFRGMADLDASFHVESGALNYLGTWTFELASPFYNRDLSMTVSSEMVETLAEAHTKFTDFKSRSITTHLANPTEIQTRLYEITPYPRVRWFRRSTAS